MKEVLHIGCGRSPLPSRMSHCHETRLDIDPNVEPDIVADMASIPDIGPFDAVYSSHSLEHLYPHDVPKCLAGILRVLKPGGAVIIHVPDLEDLSPTDEVLYEVEGGPVLAKDLFYGWSKYLEELPFMAHRTGFVQKTLHAALERAGFSSVTVGREPGYELIGVGFCP